MNRALNEFQIAGIITNTKFLNHILNTSEFKTGNYDINFIDNLNNSDSLEKNNDNPDTENEIAVSVFAALIKSKQKTSTKNNTATNSNKWWEQNYE
jgi:pyruvate carboxylase